MDIKIKQYEIDPDNVGVPDDIKTNIERVMSHFVCEEVRNRARNTIERIDSSLCKKSNERAKSHREKGNKLFSMEKFEEAASEYTEAILQAPQDQTNINPAEGTEISLAFANRSAALMKLGLYKACLVDVKQSIKHGYPQKQTKKLIAREKYCLEALNHGSLNGHCTSNENSAPLLQLDELGEKVLTATRDIGKAEIILEEEPWASTLQKSYHYTKCFYCFKDLHMKIAFPCQRCNSVKYCSEECANASWKFGHQYECCCIEVWDRLFFEVPKRLPVDLVVKILARMDLALVFKCLRHGSKMPEEYQALLYAKHQSNEAKDFAKTCGLLLTYLTEYAKLLPNVEGTNHRADVEILGALLLKCLEQLDTQVTEVQERIFKPPGVNETLENIVNISIGSAVYLKLSYFCHNCIANAKVAGFVGSKIKLVSKEAIQKGANITLSFGVSAKSHTVEERQKFLKDKYNLICTCDACTSLSQPLCRAFLCEICKGPVVAGNENLYCLQCKKDWTENKSEFLSDLKMYLIKAKSGALSLIKRDPDLRSAEHLLMESYRGLITVAYPRHKELGHVCERLSLCYKLLKKYKLSLKYMQESFLSVEEEYDKDTYEYFNALLNLIDRQKCFISYYGKRVNLEDDVQIMLKQSKESLESNVKRARQVLEMVALYDKELQEHCSKAISLV